MDIVFFYFEDWRDMSNARDFLIEDYKPVIATSYQSGDSGELYLTEGKLEDIEAFREILKKYNLKHTESNLPTKDWSHPLVQSVLKY